MKKLILLSLSAVFLSTFLYSQNPYWRAGGNTNVGIDAVTPTNNSIGTVAGNNLPIVFQTNGIQRMNIMSQNPVGSFTGAFGLGTPLPLSYMHLTNISTIGSHFRTDGPDYFRSQWEFFTGPSAGNTTRKFRVLTLANSTIDFGTLQNNENVYLEASQRDMIFNAERYIGKRQNKN